MKNPEKILKIEWELNELYKFRSKNIIDKELITKCINSREEFLSNLKWRHVYFIGNTEHKIVKIGITKNVESRLQTLQTASPYKLEYFAGYPSPIAKYIEDQLHSKYKKYRMSGEWFNLTDEILNKIDEILLNGPHTGYHILQPFKEFDKETRNRKNKERKLAYKKYIELMGRPKPRKTTLHTESPVDQVLTSFDDLFQH